MMGKKSSGKLILMRHGSTDWNSAGRLNSHTNIQVSSSGIDELKNFRTKIAEIQIDQLFVSPLQRTIQTAEILFPQMPFTVDERISEVNFGPFEGKNPDELLRSDLSHDFLQWRREKDPVCPDGTEPFSSVEKRVTSFMKDVLASNATVLAISHGVLIRMLLCECVLGLPVSCYRRLRMDNSRFAEVDFEDPLAPRLTGLNRDSFP